MRSIFTLGLFLLYLISHAQEIDYQLETEADSTETTFLSEVTIGANRWEQHIREVPLKITSIPKATIDFQNPQTTADLLNISNNVFIQKSQLGGGSPMIRGFATNRVMLVIDGVRMNNAIFRSGNVQNVISLDANAIQEAEVLFGPGSVMYGSDAIGGVMNFHTLKPVFGSNTSPEIHGNGFARYSSANLERTLHADVNIGLKKFAFVTSLTRSVYDDLKMGSHGPTAYTRPDYVARVEGEDVVKLNDNADLQLFTGYDQWNAMQKASYKINDAADVTYAFHYSKTSDYDRYDRLILKEDGEFSNAEWYYGPQKWMMHSLAFTYNQPTKLFNQSKLLIAYQDYEESRHNRGFRSARRTDRTENVKAFSVNLDLDKKFSNSITLVYGGEFITNKVNSFASRENINTGEISATTTRYPDDSDWRSLAFYAALQVEPLEKLSLNLSGRFTNVYTHAVFDTNMFNFPFTEATLDNSAVNGSAGLVYNATDKVKIYANLSTAFRAPNVDDIGKVFDSAPGEVVVPNPDLKPEQANNAEIGFATSIANWLTLDFAGYYTIINNAIARGSFLFNGEDSIVYDDEPSKVLALQNISKVWVSGIQVGITLKMSKQLSLKSSFNYQKGKEKDPETNRNNSPTHVAPLFGAAHLVFTNELLTADLYVNYNGEINYNNLALTERADSHLYAKDRNGNPYAPSWVTMNFKSSFKATNFLTIDAGVENVFDKRYRPYSSGISAPGRNLILAVRARF